MGKKVAVTATTGIASLQYRDMDPCTLHAWSGIRNGIHSANATLNFLKYNESYRQCLKNITETDVLIIDEIGLLSRRLFEILGYITASIRGSERPFGGLQVGFTLIYKIYVFIDI